MNKDKIIIYTDGSSLGNPGPGGWGSVIMTHDGKVTELGGREKESTNNRMEIMAAIQALEFVQSRKLDDKNQIVIHSDSAYLINGITMWVYGWAKNGWKTKTGDNVLNKDLWERLFKIVLNLGHKHEILWQKVSGHSGVILNERCDQIATSFSSGDRPLLFIGNSKDYEKLFGEVKKKAKSVKNKEAYSYVSCVGGQIQVDKTWEECEKRVKGKAGAKFKKSVSKEDENDIIAIWSLGALV